jgi:ABC-2 type transport system ATP-binding protein
VLDIIRPSAGTIRVAGAAPDRRNAAAIGFLPEERGLYGNMTAIDAIVYFGRLKRMTSAAARSEGMALLARFGLADRASAKISDMSKGMAQKVQLAAAIVNRPDLLILDEPFSGLDPVNQGLLEDEIVAASQRGAAVIFSTHVMQHAERLCDRLLLLKKGRKRFEGTVDEARAQLPAAIVAVATDAIRAVEGVAAAQRQADLGDGWHDWRLTLAPGVRAAAVLERCTAQAVPLRRFEEQRAGLHEVFLKLVGDEEQQP